MERSSTSPSASSTGDAASAINNSRVEEGHGDVVAPLLVKAMKTFETDPKAVLEELGKHVESGKEEQEIWFKELLPAWGRGPPKSDKDATRLVLRVFETIYPSHINVIDLEGFLLLYGLPHYRLLDGPPEDCFFAQFGIRCTSSSDDDDDDTDLWV